MENLEVGQVYRAGKNIPRKIVMLGMISLKYETPRGTRRTYLSTFRNWITRTGAKLEGIDGK